MKAEDKLAKIEALLYQNGGCLCGHSEFCEYCSPYSAVNQLKKKIRKILDE